MTALGPDAVFVILGVILAVAAIWFIAGRMTAAGPGAMDQVQSDTTMQRGEK
jgi:hypothetical protein